MSPASSEEDTKKTNPLVRPLCLFRYPNTFQECTCDEPTYVTKRKRGELARKEVRRKLNARKAKEEMWFRRRADVGMKRRKQMQENGRMLKSYLLMSVKPERTCRKGYVSCLIRALETLKDAWPSYKRLPVDRFIDDDDDESSENRPRAYHTCGTMKGEKLLPLGLTLPYLSRRMSVPEEVMRRHTVKKAATSEDSETNQTMPEATITSAKDSEEKIDSNTRVGQTDSSTMTPLKVRSRRLVGNSRKTIESHQFPELEKKENSNESIEPFFRETEQSTNDINSSIIENKSDFVLKRLTQNDYDRQGKGIIKLKTKERGSQTRRFSARSETTPTAREDTEESHTSASLTSSSPIELPRRTAENVSSSGNLSSESEDMKCTCAELTSSKDTSTDPYRSGKSTLSQTISEKSTSTQDSTVSIHSISTGGSSITTSVSYSTSPDVGPKTSAKETSSPEFTPRPSKLNFSTPLRNWRKYRHTFGKKCLRFRGKRCYRWGRYRKNGAVGRMAFSKTGEDEKPRNECSNAETASLQREEKTEISKRKGKNTKDESTASKYPWANYSPEEMYMLQQMRHQKFVDNCRRFSIPLPASPDTGSLGACAAAGSSYKEVEDLDEHILIPRYSALPRTLSMLVNTSSGDAVNSDSDSLSLEDSLEDFPITHTHRYDTKRESKPVRGDINAIQEVKKKVKIKRPRARAFFVSMKEPFGEDDLLAGITKIPEPPEKIKNRIRERQLNLIRLQKKNREKKREELRERKRLRSLKEKNEIRRRNKSNSRAKAKKLPQEHVPSREKEEEMTGQCLINAGCTPCKNEKGKANQGRMTSKIPVALHGPSTSIDTGTGKKSKKDTEQLVHGSRFRSHKMELKPPNVQDQNNTFPHNNEGSAEIKNAPKPQAVIHPSQMPTSEPELNRKKQFLISQSRPSKFRQRFEIIPEEKSSSISSPEEKKPEMTRRASLSSKPPEATINSDRGFFRKYSLGNSPNLLFAEFMGKSLQAIPCIRGGPTSDQRIFVLSPKHVASANSRKGRDALIAMNREDFNRLSKGWMNFYILKENSDSSEKSDCEDGDHRKLQDIVHFSEGGRPKAKKEQKTEISRKHSELEEMKSKNNPKGSPGEAKTSGFVLTKKAENDEVMSHNSCRNSAKRESSMKQTSFRAEPVAAQQKEMKQALNESFRFYSSNSILTPIEVCSKEPKKDSSLPHLNPPSFAHQAVDNNPKSNDPILVLPKVTQKASENDGTDSDSTVYCQPPSFIVPRLILDGSGDFPSEGSCTDSDSESDEIENKMIAYPVRSAPPRKRGLPLRLRHRREGHRVTTGRGYPGWSVTVEGTLELTSSAPDLEMRLSFPVNGSGPPQASQSDSGFAEDPSQKAERSSGRELGMATASDGNTKQRWTVTVKNPNQDAEEKKRKINKSHLLPVLGQPQTLNLKKVLKKSASEYNLTNRDQKLPIYWPNIDLSEDEWTECGTNDEELSVRGIAILMEKKPRPPTMTERDLTRGATVKDSRKLFVKPPRK